jgi:hypothetical protein
MAVSFSAWTGWVGFPLLWASPRLVGAAKGLIEACLERFGALIA